MLNLLIQKMIETNIQIRINTIEINKYLYSFKTKYQFEKEFNFKAGKELGKGTFGIVKKCFSKLYNKYFAIK